MFPRPPNTVPYISPSLPVEVVLTAGQIALSLYSVEDERSGSARYKGRKKKVSKKVRLRCKNSERYRLFFCKFLQADDDQGYEASEESTDDRADSYKKYIPLVYVCFTQPNAFFTKQQLGRKLQVEEHTIILLRTNTDYFRCRVLTLTLS